MASVIYLDSSDEEDEPVFRRAQAEPDHSTNPTPRSTTPNSNVVACKVESYDEFPGMQARHVQDGNVQSRTAASCSTSDQAWDSMGVQAERRAKPSSVGKGKGAAGPSSSAQGNPICRQFWQAGDYENQVIHRRGPIQGSMDHVRVHPKFLHSNATSHKWALGAIAELLDNAVDEIENGATFVRVDKIKNARDGNPALLVEDNGGGMSPDDIRQCMSLGYSRKNKRTTIGQYGNGFKTSTMRLGADVIVFTRNTAGGKTTQSIGLLSFTFLRKTGHEDTVVPMVDYDLSPDGVRPTVLLRTTEEHWMDNLQTITVWSPYGSEEQLLRQFDNMGLQGTKVIVFNLWLNDEGILELDFESDAHDIQLRVGSKELPKQATLSKLLEREHISNRHRLSLREYASILYLQMPEDFQIILRGKPVKHNSIAGDLKFVQYIAYKPQIGTNRDSTNKETSVITTIGFVKEAPHLYVHGFNVYHRNRLIKPFWQVFHESSSRGRGVVGVLEANFIEPAHDKQDFERTSVFLRLETRLKQMTSEYWSLHCHLIGYQPTARVKQSLPARSLNSGPDALPSSSAPPTSTTTIPSPTGSSSSGQRPVINDDGPSNGNGGVHASAAASGPSTPPRPGVEGADLAFTERAVEETVVGAALETPRITSGNVLPAKHNIEGSTIGVKRQIDVEEFLVDSKRQRRGTEAAPSSTRDASTMTVATSDTGALMVEVLEQNTKLRDRCTEYEVRQKHWEQKLIMQEQRERHWELKVEALEKEIMDHKIKYTKLVGQMETMKATAVLVNNQRNGVCVETPRVVKLECKDPVARRAG